MDPLDEKRFRGPYCNYQTGDGLRIPQQTLYSQRKRFISNTLESDTQQHTAAIPHANSSESSSEESSVEVNRPDHHQFSFQYIHSARF